MATKKQNNPLKTAIAEMLLSDVEGYRDDINRLLQVGLQHVDDETKAYWALWFSGLGSAAIERAESAIKPN